MPPDMGSFIKRTRGVLPSNGSVLVVLRGEAMRTPKEAWEHDGVVSGHVGCDPRGFNAQMNASRSVMANIVQPLVERQNTVDIIATEYPCRDWPRQISEIYSIYRAHQPSSVERFREFARGQKQNFEWTLQSVGRHVRESDRYDMVVITRHDVIWKKPIVEWQSLDPDKFNFASPCQGWRTVNDILHTMPGRMLHTFLDKPYWTHFDYDKAIKEYGKVGVEVGFALADSAEKMGGGVVRSENPWYEIY